MYGTPQKTPPYDAIVAVAACAVEPPRVSSGALQIFPPGAFSASQGSLAGQGPWKIDAALAAAVIARARSRSVKLPIDAEHATLLRRTPDGAPVTPEQPAGQVPLAVGWINPDRLLWDDARGLIDPAPEWTPAAAAAIDAGEVRYGSPVFKYRPGTGEVLELINFTLTNRPAIDGYTAIGAASSPPLGGTYTVEDIRERLRYLLNLPLTVTDEELVQHLDKLKTLIGATGAASLPDLVSNYTTLKASAEAAAATAATSAPLALVTQLQGEIAALQASAAQREVEELVQAGLGDGRILPAMESWARGLAATSLPAFREFLAQAQPIAALTASQTGGKPPPGVAGGVYSLSPEEVAVCTATGLSHDEFRAARQAEQEG